MDSAAFLKIALNFLAQSRPFILETLVQGMGAKTKADSSVVTNADIGTEKLFRSYIGQQFPEHGILGEEFGHSNPDAEYQWVIDPIDGTAEFARRMPEYGTLIGLFHRKKPLVGIIDLPSMDETYSAALGCGAYRNTTKLDLRLHTPDPVALNRRVATSPPWNYLREGGNLQAFSKLMNVFPNLRIYHSCYTQALAAGGGVDASVEWNLKIWDLAAAQIIVEEAGGSFIVLQEPQDWAKGFFRVVMGSKEVAAKVAAAIRA